jgi:hypothetical protein
MDACKLHGKQGVHRASVGRVSRGPVIQNARIRDDGVDVRGWNDTSNLGFGGKGKLFGFVDACPRGCAHAYDDLPGVHGGKELTPKKRVEQQRTYKQESHSAQPPPACSNGSFQQAAVGAMYALGCSGDARQPRAPASSRDVGGAILRMQKVHGEYRNQRHGENLRRRHGKRDRDRQRDEDESANALQKEDRQEHNHGRRG